MAEGYRVFVQNLWPGGYANPITVAESNLRQAREAGLIPCGYINTNPWFSANISLLEAKANAGAEWEHLAVVFNDIEIAGVNEAQCRQHTEAIVAEGKRTAIYSAKWFWDSIGNPQWPWLKSYGVWVADYDGDPNIATSRLFGPWALDDVVGKQYTNTTDLAGVSVDINEFKDSFFQGSQEEDDMQPDERKWLEETRNALYFPVPFFADRTNTIPAWQAMLLVYKILTDDVDPGVPDNPRFAAWASQLSAASIPEAAADAKAFVAELGKTIQAGSQADT